MTPKFQARTRNNFFKENVFPWEFYCSEVLETLVDARSKLFASEILT